MSFVLSLFLLVPRSASAGNQTQNVGDSLKASRFSALKGLRVGPGDFPIDQKILKPFSSDGCSVSPNTIPGTNISLVYCCVAHDINYWLGGSEAEKNQADLALRACIEKKSDFAVAEIYYRGVRIGGGPLRSNSYRWGYGWNYLRPFSPLNSNEILQAESFYGPGMMDLITKFKNNEIKLVDTNDKSDASLIPLNENEKHIYEYLNQTLNADTVVQDITYRIDAKGSYQFSLKIQTCGSVISIETSSARSPLHVSDKTSCLKH